jgi:hypothetical protein
MSNALSSTERHIHVQANRYTAAAFLKVREAEQRTLIAWSLRRALVACECRTSHRLPCLPAGRAGQSLVIGRGRHAKAKVCGCYCSDTTALLHLSLRHALLHVSTTPISLYRYLTWPLFQKIDRIEQTIRSNQSTNIANRTKA